MILVANIIGAPATQYVHHFFSISQHDRFDRALNGTLFGRQIVLLMPDKRSRRTHQELKVDYF